MGQLRRDPLSGRVVVVAPLRGLRPGAGPPRADDEGEEGGECPFCEGREHLTPPETYAVGPPGRTANGPGWTVRVVPNKYPALTRDGEARGVQEVVIHGPRHVRSLSELDDRTLAAVVEAWRARAAVARAEGLGYVQAIVNEGRAAGSSLPHSHSQLVWLPDEPPGVERERAHQSCPLCELLEAELAEGRRVVDASESVIAIASPAGRTPYELLVAPRRCEPDAYASDVLEDALRSATAAIRRLHELEGRVPLNLWLHTAAFGRGGFHWHLELVPRLTVLAGLELGAELYVNPLPPEEAARALRPL